MRIYQSLYDRLKNQHQTVFIITHNLADEKLAKSPGSGKWSIHDHIAHLARYQPVFMQRVEKILYEENPSLAAYTAEEDPDFGIWRSWSTQDLLENMAAHRNHIFNKITGLTDKELSRTGIHEKYGSMDVVSWTEFFLLHEAHHIFTIFRMAVVQ